MITSRLAQSVQQPFTKLEAGGSNLGTCSSFLFSLFFFVIIIIYKLLLFSGLLAVRS